VTIDIWALDDIPAAQSGLRIGHVHDRMRGVTSVVILGGGPGGYEAALVGSQLGGQVTLVDSDGVGGSAVLTDCVPSKTLIATAEVMTQVAESSALGLRIGPADAHRDALHV